MNTIHTGEFTYQANFYEWNSSTAVSNLTCKAELNYLGDEDSWSLIIEQFSPEYDDKLDKIILEGLTFPCLHSDGFCKPTLKHPYTVVCFTVEKPFKFHIFDFIGQMYQLNNRYWLGTDDFFKTTEKITDKISKGILPTAFLYNNFTKTENFPTEENFL